MTASSLVEAVQMPEALSAAGHRTVSPTEQRHEKSSRFYRPELDAIRFFLFLGVFVNHALNNNTSSALARGHYSAMALHVFHDACGFSLSFFFFLSSYLITCLLQLEKRKTGTLDLRKFYVRRMLRLWPLYVGYIALVCLLSTFSHGCRVTAGVIASMLLFSGNWYYIMMGGFPTALLNHLWSISVEEQFYVLFPFFTRRFSAIRIQQGCLAICVVALAATWILVSRKEPLAHVWGNSVVESIFFASGAIYALRDSLKEHAKSAPKAVLGISGGYGLWLIAQSGNIISYIHSPRPWPAVGCYLLADLGCASILWGTLRVPLAWLPKPLVYLGRIAYGLYVLHMLVIYKVREYISPHIRIPGASMAIELAIVMILATISYEYFEKPFLKLKHRFELVHSRTA